MNLFIAILILFLIENGVGMEGEGQIANVQPFQPKINLSQPSPALTEKAEVKYSDVPFRRTLQMQEKSDKKERGNDQKGRDNAKNPASSPSNYNLSQKNRFSALEGLTERRQRKLFMDKSVKDSKFKNKGKQCEEDCNDDISSKTVGKIETNKDVVVQVGNKDLSKKCCNKQNYLGVVITAMLAFSGMQNIANVSNLQNTFDCKIYPNNIFNNYMPSCNLVYNCSSTTTCCPDHYICGTNKMYLQVKSKDFHNYIDNDQPFKMYCPVGNSGEDVLVAEGYGNCDVEAKDKCEIVLGEITN